jgi:hypothetical protein
MPNTSSIFKSVNHLLGMPLSDASKVNNTILFPIRRHFSAFLVSSTCSTDTLNLRLVLHESI